MYHHVKARRHHSALLRLARIGFPATSTKTGFVCTDGKIRTAIQLDFGTSISKLSGRICPSASIS